MAELILALDLPSGAAALKLLDRISTIRWVKVGSVLMTRAGAPLLQELRTRGLQVFLDLKWHDIPNTVQGAVAAAREQGVGMATVHTLGGRQMMAAAAEAAGADLGVVGVTVLTSHAGASYGDAIGREGVDLKVEVVRQAANAVTAGLRGIVCSPLEVAAVRPLLPANTWIVVPGIRRGGESADDQTRVAGPAAAVAAGATHLVVGRPILASPDPAGTVARFLEEMR
ncbi:MAG: orotidine-5'-phosphate decarboxylase [Gemmatimonadota bacterium]|nr:orotidine-5'-phosphate decarboxylase [Gemmatimonadota bacterium]